RGVRRSALPECARGGRGPADRVAGAARGRAGGAGAELPRRRAGGARPRTPARPLETAAGAGRVRGRPGAAAVRRGGAGEAPGGPRAETAVGGEARRSSAVGGGRQAGAP